MRLEARKYLFDIQRAAESIAAFCEGGDFEQYLRDELSQAAVERKFGIIGEALAADAAVEAGAAVYRAEDVHAWLERLAKNEKPSRPR